MPSPARKPARTPLTQRRILEAALALIDARGLDELTMRALGSDLGVEAMSIYKHLPGKGAVLDGVVELLLEDLRVDEATPDDWRAQLAALARMMRGLSRDHPGAFPLLRRRSVSAYVVGREGVEHALELMLAAGFGKDEAVAAMRTVMRHVLGFALSDPLASASEDGPALEMPAEMAGEHPLVADLLSALSDRAGEDALFEYGLRALIAGMAPASGGAATA